MLRILIAAIAVTGVAVAEQPEAADPLHDKVIAGLADWTLVRDKVRQMKRVIMAYHETQDYYEGVPEAEQKHYYTLQLHNRPAFHYWGTCVVPLGHERHESWYEFFQVKGKWYKTDRMAKVQDLFTKRDEESLVGFLSGYHYEGCASFVDCIAVPSVFAQKCYVQNSNYIEAMFLGKMEFESAKRQAGGKIKSVWKLDHKPAKAIDYTVELIQDEAYDMLPVSVKYQSLKDEAQFLSGKVGLAKEYGSMGAVPNADSQYVFRQEALRPHAASRHARHV